jgi:hypothetical protein
MTACHKHCQGSKYSTDLLPWKCLAAVAALAALRGPFSNVREPEAGFVTLLEVWNGRLQNLLALFQTHTSAPISTCRSANLANKDWTPGIQFWYHAQGG